jgi:polysaccharide export outer membrane protein
MLCVPACQLCAQSDAQPILQVSSSKRAGSHQDAVARGTALALAPRDIEKLRIAPGFLLGVSVLGDDDYNGSYRVDEHGDIAVPILGTLHLAGNNAPEATEVIKARILQMRLLVDPQVTVSIAEYISTEVIVLGEVSAPGKYPLLAPHSLVDVLATAGGLSTLAGDQISITGQEPGAQPKLIHYTRSTPASEVAQVMIQPGDTVEVSRAGIVYVLGGVNRPGGFVMQEEGKITLLQAVALANGASVLSSTKTVFLLHKNPDGTLTETNIALAKVERGKSADIPLQARDIVYVPISGIKVAFNDLESIIASAASSSIYLLR